MSENLTERLTGWLETSGRALELRMSRAARKAGAAVDQSWTYQDGNTGKAREGDVLASFRWEGLEKRPMDLHVVVECKSSTKHPWVAFMDRAVTPGTDIANWTLFAHGPFVGLTEPLSETWIGLPPFSGSRAATHITTAFEKGNDPAADALQQVRSQAQGLWDHHLNSTGRGLQGGGIVIVAAVVTSCPLFTAELDREGEIKLTEVDKVQVRAQGHNGVTSRVWVLNEEPAQQFFADLRDRAFDAGLHARSGRG